MQKTLYIPLDTTLDNTVECEKLIKRGDTLTLTIKVFSNGVLANLTGQSIDLIFRKSDNTLIEKTIDTSNILNGVITATLSKQATLAQGLVSGELQIYTSDTLSSTNTFTFNVDTSVADDVLEVSQNDIQVLNDLRVLINQGQIEINKYNDCILAIGNTIEAIEALANIKAYIDTNLPLLETENAEAVVNIARLKIENDKSPTLTANLKTQNDSSASNIATLTTKNAEAVANKNNLDSSSSAAISTKNALDTSNTNATNTKNALNTSITNANTSKGALDISKTNADTSKAELDISIEEANNFIEAHQDIENLVTQVNKNTASLSEKVQKVDGKGLSTNDYDNTEKAEVAKVKDKADKTYTDSQLVLKANKSEVTNVMTPKGNIAYALLPTTGNTVGNYYYCLDGDGTHGAGNYVWNGTTWYFGGTGNEGYNIVSDKINDLSDIFRYYGEETTESNGQLSSFANTTVYGILYFDTPTYVEKFTPVANGSFSWCVGNISSGEIKDGKLLTLSNMTSANAGDTLAINTIIDKNTVLVLSGNINYGKPGTDTITSDKIKFVPAMQSSLNIVYTGFENAVFGGTLVTRKYYNNLLSKSEINTLIENILPLASNLEFSSGIEAPYNDANTVPSNKIIRYNSTDGLYHFPLESGYCTLITLRNYSNDDTIHFNIQLCAYPTINRLFYRIAFAEYSEWIEINPNRKVALKNVDIHFTFTANTAFPNNSIDASVQDSEVLATYYGVIHLPSTYKADGTPTKLVLCSHSSYVPVTANSFGAKPQVQKLIDNGYAVFDCCCVDDDATNGINLGSPKSINGFKKAYDYIISNYNVEHKLYVYGASQGGLLALNFTNRFPELVKVVGLVCPVTDLYGQAWQHPWDVNNKQYIRTFYNFSDKTSSGEYEIDKTIGLNPIYAHSVVINSERYNFFHCPIKIWHGNADNTVAFSGSQNYINSLKRAGCEAYLREINGVDHGAFDYEQTELLYWFNRF